MLEPHSFSASHRVCIRRSRYTATSSGGVDWDQSFLCNTTFSIESR